MFGGAAGLAATIGADGAAGASDLVGAVEGACPAVAVCASTGDEEKRKPVSNAPCEDGYLGRRSLMKKRPVSRVEV